MSSLQSGRWMPRVIAACRLCPCRNGEFRYLLLTELVPGSVALRGRGQEMTLSFPPFTRAVIWLLGINTAVFLSLRAFGTLALIEWVYAYLGLVPRTAVFHFAIWQIVTYSFIHVTFWHWFG